MQLQHGNLPNSEARIQARNPVQDGRLCDLCGGCNFRLLHQWAVGDRWNPASVPIAVWQCDCKMVMLHPVPGPEQLPGGGEWWTGERQRPIRNRRFKRVRTAVQHLLFGTPRTRLLRATRLAMPNGRLLDIGCGRGGLLRIAAKSYDCVGLEPSPVAAAVARGRGFQVIEANLEDAQLQPASFDVVLMDSVIEHFASPLDALRIANRALHDHGIIVLKTPKFGGPAYRRHGACWGGFRHGYHTWLFSGHTLSRALATTGFEVLRRPRRDRPLDDVLILWGRKMHDLDASGATNRADNLAA